MTPVPEEGAGCRFRISQYVRPLAREGFDVTVSPFYTPEFFRMVYRPGHTITKAAWFLRQTLGRLREVLATDAYDLLFLYREAMPIGPPVIEQLLARPGRPPIVYDFDDAVFLPNTSDANSCLAALKCPEKIGQVISKSTIVVAGNEYLATYARAHSPRVTVIPTVVDTDVFVPRAAGRAEGDPLVVGWIGTPTTATYLDGLMPVLSRVHAERPFKLRVAGAGRPFSCEGIDVANITWKLEDEVALFSTCDIGVYPMPDDEWTKGKCGFKAIQFMACGVPVVASAVGVNTEIIEDGVNGFLATTPDEWIDKLTRLAGDAALRRRIGDAGRQTIEQRYSLAVSAPRMAATLREALDRGASRH